MPLFSKRQEAREQRRLDARRAESRRIAQELRSQLISSPLCSDYENLFAQVRPLINDMKMVRPYGVGANGAKLPKSRTPELNILDYPNEEMGWAEFADLIFATWLTKDQLYIHAWKQGRRILGYTVLPAATRYWDGNGYAWQVTTAEGATETLTEDDVMTLRFSRSPDNPAQGISPATAIRVWTQVDDVVGQYQRAYFENGAIPATLTFITASTQEKYDAVRHELEHKTRGADNANKTVYIWRQMLPDTGETKDQIEVKTIQAPNSTMAIKDIVTIVNDKLNKSLGVSNFILGDDSSAKYDNAELSDYQFIKRRVYPALVSFWSQFQHELDRITGGLGYGISFDLEIPDLTERLRVQAETNAKNAETLTKMIQAGASAEFATAALGLNTKWFNAGIGIQSAREADRALAKLQALQAVRSQTEKATSAPETARTAEDKLRDSIEAHTCCDHRHNDELAVEFGDDERTAKTIYDQLVSLARAIVTENPSYNFEKVEAELVELLKNEAADGGTAGLKSLEDLIKDPQTVQIIKGAIEHGYDISDALTDRIKERTHTIVEDYSRETRERMTAVLNNAEELTANEIRKRLEEIVPKQRAAMIARNETVYAFRSGRLEADKDMADRYGFASELKLVWRCTKDGNTCDVCAAMDGQTTTIGRAYNDQIELMRGTILPNGRRVGIAPEGASKEEAAQYTGTTTFAFRHDFWNDQGEVPSAHVNCRCYFDEILTIEGTA